MVFAPIEPNRSTLNMVTDYIADLEICQQDMNDVVESLVIELEKDFNDNCPASNTLKDKLDEAVPESLDVSTVLLQTDTNESSNNNVDRVNQHQPGTESAKKVTTLASHPKYSVMISDAITFLQSRNGSSRQAIFKYVKDNYQITHPQAGKLLNMALKAGINKGSLIMARSSGKGIECFKLGTKESFIGLKKLASKSSARAKKHSAQIPKKIAIKKFQEKPIFAGKNVSTKKVNDTPKLNAGVAFNQTSGKKSEPFKLVRSNVYRTCACLEMCATDSCACFGYLQECSELCECGDSCSNTGLTRGEGKRVFLATSDVHGTGCFAGEDIEEGDFVGEYVGQIVSKVDAARKRNQSKFLFMTGDKNFVIDASKFGSELTRMNHKDKKSGENCEFKLKRVRGEWRVGVWALEDISKGVELFADYGDQYWEYNNNIIL